MNISIIISTYKRHEDLKIAIDSILKQSTIPKEIIVVDSANDIYTKQLLTIYSDNDKGIQTRYIHNPVDSTSIAKNVGADAAKGDILLFLDDDVILYEHFIKEILEAYETYPNASIVQGNIEAKNTITKSRRLWNIIWNRYAQVFYLFHFTNKKMNILPSGKNTAPLIRDEFLNCQWASGCCLSIKSEVFSHYRFDNKLVKYSYCEDADLSYRIYKNDSESIYLAPNAKLIHKGSFNKNSPVKAAVIMEKTYNMYFMAKNLGKTTNYILFFWSEIGAFTRDIIYLFIHIRNMKKYYLFRLMYSLSAYYICLRHISKIKHLDIEYINERYII